MDVLSSMNIAVYPNPVSDVLAIQCKGLNTSNVVLELFDMQGKLVKSTILKAGTTIAIMQVDDVYSGQYIVRTKDGKWSSQVMIAR